MGGPVLRKRLALLIPPTRLRAHLRRRRVVRLARSCLGDRDRTFDRDRPLTPLSELVERHSTGFASEADRHWTVWTRETFLELCAHLGLDALEVRDPDTKGGNGFALVLAAGA